MAAKIVGSESTQTNDLLILQDAHSGNNEAFNQVLLKYRDRLKRMVGIRMNRKLQGRLDASDVIQDSFLEAARALPAYLENPKLPVYIWLRHLAGEKLIQAHRRHLTAQKRTAEREQPIFGGAPAATSLSLAHELACSMATPSQAAAKNEACNNLIDALSSMNEIDREILTLKHFEHLTSREAAEVLGMTYEAVKKRHVRALEKLQKIMAEQA
jgi:RNA polymerase sigma-70 factor (ECF subfamily)